MLTKFNLLFSLIIFSHVSIAEIAPSSLTGEFNVSTCNTSTAKKATITLQQDAKLGNIVQVIFQEATPVIINFLLESKNLPADNLEVNVSRSSFVITNDYYVNQNGLVTKMSEARLGRSASGNRVRINTLDLLNGIETECVLYHVH